ncbi:MAG: universal stress protein [Candidatus Sulfotelmatobacter sp.]|jgi:nucleotide-binding universal stress UspA family protein
MQPTTASHFIPTRILVPLDFSSSSDAVLETASDLAQHFHAEIYLVHVVAMLPMGTNTVSFRETEYLHKAEHNADGRLAACEAVLASQGIKASSSIEVGNDGGVETYGPGAPYVVPEWKAEIVGYATREIAKLQQDLGTKAEVIIDSGNVCNRLNRVVDQTQGDVLVIGHMPSGGHLGENGGGDAIIRESHIPVLSV